MAGVDLELASSPPSGDRQSDELTAAAPENHEDEPIKVTVKFGPAGFSGTWAFPDDATLDELVVRCDDLWPEFDWSQCKLMVETRARRPGVKALLKAHDDGDLELSLLDGNTLKLLAQKRAEIQALHAASAAATAQQARRAAVLQRARARAARSSNSTSTTRRDQQRARDDAQYTFHTVRPLPYLPRPERSRAFLERLKADPGIRAAMRKHQFSVGLLTEMDPAAHTSSSHEGTSRTLGLNRNRGEVVELRLRTDAYDGYRDYRTIRRTLCHELAHNVHGPHDRAFWDLCHQIEREVDAADWTSGGHTVGQDEFAPERGVEEDEVMDHGGWAGGEFVLGGGGGSSSSGSGGGRSNGGAEPLSRREILARAAEERIRNLEKANRSDEGGGSGETHEGSQS